MKKRNILCIISLLCTLVCCTTAPATFSGKANLHGMVYDFANRPVAGYVLQADEHIYAVSDVTGRFMFNDLTGGTHNLRGSAENFESYAGEFTLTDNKQILYLRIPHISHLMDLTEKALSENKYEETENYIQRIFTIDIQNTDALFYKAILLFRQKHIQRSSDILEKLVYEGSREPVVFLFLADIYQYYLLDGEKALSNLKKYHNLAPSEKIQKRIQEIQSDEN